MLLNNDSFDRTGPDPFYSPANQERLLKAAAEMDAGAGTVHELTGTEGESTLDNPCLSVLNYPHQGIDEDKPRQSAFQRGRQELQAAHASRSCTPSEPPANGFQDPLSRTGEPVTANTSGRSSMRQAGWNRGIMNCYPTPEKPSGVGFFHP